jgi:hypothetical protein
MLGKGREPQISQITQIRAEDGADLWWVGVSGRESGKRIANSEWRMFCSVCVFAIRYSVFAIPYSFCSWPFAQR